MKPLIISPRLPDDIVMSPVKTTRQRKPTTTEKMISDETPVPTTPGPTSCAANTRIFDYVPDAFTFGEEDTSLIQINVSKKEVQRKYVCNYICNSLLLLNVKGTYD